LKIKIVNNVLEISLPLLVKPVKSASGKSMVVATTSGFVAIPDTDRRISINVIAPK